MMKEEDKETLAALEGDTVAPGHREMPYGVVIVETRYGGAYEGGTWAAFILETRDIPEDAFGDDTSCAGWWAEVGMQWCAVGETPNQAYLNMKKKLVAWVEQNPGKKTWDYQRAFRRAVMEYELGPGL